jgi:hypothetical protein
LSKQAKKLAAPSQCKGTIEINLVHPQPGLTLDFDVANETCKMIIDSGAAVTLVQFDLVHKLNIPITPSLTLARSASGHSLDIVGEASIPFRLNGIVMRHNALVLKNIPGGIGLLGLDFLVKFDGVLHVNDRKLSFPHGEVSLLQSSTGGIKVVTTLDTHDDSKGLHLIKKIYDVNSKNLQDLKLNMTENRCKINKVSQDEQKCMHAYDDINIGETNPMLN